MPDKAEEDKKHYLNLISVFIALNRPGNVAVAVRAVKKHSRLDKDNLGEFQEVVAESIRLRLGDPPYSKVGLHCLFDVVCALHDEDAAELLGKVKPEWIDPVVELISRHAPDNEWAYDTAYFLRGLMDHKELAEAFKLAYNKLDEGKKALMREFNDEETRKKKSLRAGDEWDEILTDKMKKLLGLTDTAKSVRPDNQKKSWFNLRLWSGSCSQS